MLKFIYYFIYGLVEYNEIIRLLNIKIIYIGTFKFINRNTI